MAEAVAIDGNMAAAYGAMLSRPQLITVYPITPLTPLLEHLAKFAADGLLNAQIVEAESEYAMISILQGASLAGGRTFTGSASQGLALMYEPYFRTATLRLPIVMCVASREMMSPTTTAGGQQDVFAMREAGWIQLFAESNQEILDLVIQAYRIAEDERVLLPVNVCYDGYYSSHLIERVVIPDQEAVDSFLGSYKPRHVYLDPKDPIMVDPMTPGGLLLKYRQSQAEAQTMAKRVITEVGEAYGLAFGRNYGGLIEPYLAEDAEFLLLTTGSVSGTARAAIDEMRRSGKGWGLLRLRSIRPFPRREIAEAARGKKAIGIIERNVCFGWGSGSLWMEARAALAGQPFAPRVIDFIGGLGGSDIPIEQIFWAMEKVVSALGRAPGEEDIFWLEEK